MPPPQRQRLFSLVASALIILLLLPVAWFGVRALGDVLEKAPHERGWRRHITRGRALPMVLVLLIVGAALPAAIEGNVPGLGTTLIVTAAFAIWAWGKRPRLAVALLCVGVVLWVYVQALYDLAGDAAERVKRGESPGTDLFGIPMVPWRASPAELRWPNGPEVKPCVLVLASDERGSIVYASERSGRRRRLTITPEQARIEVIPDLARCPWPPRQPPDPNDFK